MLPEEELLTRSATSSGTSSGISSGIRAASDVLTDLASSSLDEERTGLLLLEVSTAELPEAVTDVEE